MTFVETDHRLPGGGSLAMRSCWEWSGGAMPCVDSYQVTNKVAYGNRRYSCVESKRRRQMSEITRVLDGCYLKGIHWTPTTTIEHRQQAPPRYSGWRLKPPDLLLRCLTTETVKGLTLTLERIDNVHGRYSLTTSMLRVGDRVANDVLEENLEDTTGLFVDETGNALDTTTTSETANGGLGNTLDVVTKDLAMTLGTSFSESFSSFSAARHDFLFFVREERGLRTAYRLTNGDVPVA